MCHYCHMILGSPSSAIWHMGHTSAFDLPTHYGTNCCQNKYKRLLKYSYLRYYEMNLLATVLVLNMVFLEYW